MDRELAQDILDHVDEVRMHYLVGFDKARRIDRFTVVPTEKWEHLHEIFQLQCSMLESFAKEYLNADD